MYIQGKLDLAKDQLATRKLCGSTQCEEYGDLSQAITKRTGFSRRRCVI